MSKISYLLNQGRIFEIKPRNLGKSPMKQEEMKAIFNYFDAFWQYDGEPSAEKPHALLKGGKHSNGFIACKNVLRYPIMCKLFANEIVKVFETKCPLQKVDVVVSSAYSAIDLGHDVARILSKKYPKIEYIIVQKDDKGNPTEISGGIDASKNVLVINELMTTGNGSTWETKQAVMNCNGPGNPEPYIINKSFVLVHRSKDYELPDGSKVIPIFHFDIDDWDVENGEECPYCKAGSQAIKPKVGNNWNIIHRRM